MARPLRIQFPGANYHVTARMLGNWKKQADRLFEDDRDRLRFLERLGQRVDQYDIRLFLFTLMANHVHLRKGPAICEPIALEQLPGLRGNADAVSVRR